MTNEIRGARHADAELRIRAERDSAKEPGKVNEKDRLAFEERLKVLREGRDGEWAVAGDERSGKTPEEIALATARRSAAPEREENPFSGFGDRGPFAAKAGDDEEAEAPKGMPGSVFDLVGQMSARLAGSESAVVTPAQEVTISRRELVAKIAEAAETMLVMEARGARDRSEIKVDFKSDFLPATGVTVSRSGADGALEIVFDTANAKVNLFLENSNASLREQLAQRFGCEVAVTVNYRPRDDDAGAEQDQRGRRPGWDGLTDGLRDDA